VLMFSCLLLSFVAYHQFSIASFKTVPVLRKLLKSLMEKRRCSCCAKAQFVSMRLAEGRRPKGSGGAWRRSCIYRSKCIVDKASKRPSGQRVATPFQRH
jgi:hypothetical protein